MSSNLSDSKLMENQKSALKAGVAPVAGGSVGAFFMFWARHISDQLNEAALEEGVQRIQYLWPQSADVIAPVVFAGVLSWLVRTVNHWRNT